VNLWHTASSPVCSLIHRQNLSRVELVPASETEAVPISGSVTERSHYRDTNQSSVLWLDEFVSQIGARSGWKREPIGTEYKSSVS
jgi:hypothetical protein